MPDMLHSYDRGSGNLIKGTFEYRMKLAPCAEPSAELNEFCRLFERTRDLERSEREASEDRIRDMGAAVAHLYSGAPASISFEQELLLTTARDGVFDSLREWLILSVRPAKQEGGFLLPIPLPGTPERGARSSGSFESFTCAPEIVCYLPASSRPIIRVLMSEACLRESTAHAEEAAKAIREHGFSAASDAHPSWVISELVSSALTLAPKHSSITSIESLETSMDWEVRTESAAGENVLRFKVLTNGIGIPGVVPVQP
jgi:hypothetical protein